MAVLLVALLAIGAPLAQGKIFQRYQVPELPEASRWLPVTESQPTGGALGITEDADTDAKSSPPDKLQRRHGYDQFPQDKVCVRLGGSHVIMWSFSWQFPLFCHRDLPVSVTKEGELSTGMVPNLT
jgi:hypothetical protein